MIREVSFVRCRLVSSVASPYSFDQSMSCLLSHYGQGFQPFGLSTLAMTFSKIVRKPGPKEYDHILLAGLSVELIICCYT